MIADGAIQLTQVNSYQPVEERPEGAQPLQRSFLNAHFDPGGIGMTGRRD